MAADVRQVKVVAGRCWPPGSRSESADCRRLKDQRSSAMVGAYTELLQILTPKYCHLTSLITTSPPFFFLLPSVGADWFYYAAVSFIFNSHASIQMHTYKNSQANVLEFMLGFVCSKITFIQTKCRKEKKKHYWLDMQVNNNKTIRTQEATFNFVW